MMVQALHINQGVEGHESVEVSVPKDLSGCEGVGNAVAVGLYKGVGEAGVVVEETLEMVMDNNTYATQFFANNSDLPRFAQT